MFQLAGFAMRATVLTLVVLPSVARLPADEIVYRNEAGESIRMAARLIGSAQGFQAFERSDGQILLVATGAIEGRTPADEPVPIDPPGMGELLKAKFGEDLVRTEIKAPFVVGLVLSSPIERTAEAKASAFLKKASKFMDTVDDVFVKFARSVHFPLQEPKFPLVLLIFESDSDFDSYATEATGGNGLTVQSILGFYSGLTNWLAVRMSACDTFEVPLHEAIHQQMYNRVFQRFAPVPKWFDEGIATGFESAGDRIDVHPSRINSRYARQAKSLSGAVDWQKVIADDGAFTADIMAGEAYTTAWCMHWMLCTQHEPKYLAYVTQLSQREPFEELDEGARVKQFEEAFGLKVDELQGDFSRALEAGVKRQKINLNASAPAVGRSTTQQALGSVDITARTVNGGPLQVEGGLKNISPIRTLSFYVTVESSAGVYADWMLPDVKPGQTMKLKQQLAVKQYGGTGGPPGTFRVNIRSVPSGSEESTNWKSGGVPGPTE